MKNYEGFHKSNPEKLKVLIFTKHNTKKKHPAIAMALARDFMSWAVIGVVGPEE